MPGKRLTFSAEEWEEWKGELPAELRERAEPAEEVFFFEPSRELILVSPGEELLGDVSRVATLESSSGELYKFSIGRMDLWNSDLDREEAVAIFDRVLPRDAPSFMDWVARTFDRAEVFSIRKEGPYYVLAAANADRMAYARQVDAVAEHLVAEITDTKSRIASGSKARAQIKEALLDKGYPVTDAYDFRDVDEALDIDLTVDLRPYQEEMLETADELGAAVLANPSGSGKTVTAIGMLAHVDQPTLILVPQRSLIPQWREELLDKTTATEDMIGEYHGDEKELNDITLATYHIVGSRTEVFRKDWGLIVFDEVHHIPATVFRTAANLQSVRRIGLSASPVREDSKEREIFTLIGPEIGGDWSLFFQRGDVLKPEVHILFVPWADDGLRQQYEEADGIKKSIIAGKNPAKEERLEQLLEQHAEQKVIVFADWIDQGEQLSEEFDIPFVSGETDHDRREDLLDEFRDSDRTRLIISRIGDEGLDIPDAEVGVVMSGQGGSRRQATQRAGRVMRPIGDATMYFVATRGTVEEDFVHRQMELLREKGITVHVEE